MYLCVHGYYLIYGFIGNPTSAIDFFYGRFCDIIFYIYFYLYCMIYCILDIIITAIARNRKAIYFSTTWYEIEFECMDSKHMMKQNQ